MIFFISLYKMDSATLGQYSGYIALLISMGAMIIGVINHKKCVSRCGQRVSVVSLDIGPSSVDSPKPVTSATPPTSMISSSS